MNEFWSLVATAGLILISAVTRSFFFIGDRDWKMPQWLSVGLRYAPIGALAAVALPTLLEGAQDPGLGGMPLKVIAGAVALAFAFWRKDMLLTIIVGMVTYHVVRWTI